MKALRIVPLRTTALRKVPQPLHLRPLQHQQQRTFLPNPFGALGGGASPSTPQTLTATRTLPYPSAAIYNIIADVSSYSSFLPYCQSSEVTKWSRPDAQGKRWPAEAKLVVGWQSISESFTSRIYCVPGALVEAVSGSTKTKLNPDQIPHHDEQLPATAADPADHALLSHLLTRWSVQPFPYQPPSVSEASAKASNPIDPQAPASGQPKEQTQVTLNLEFTFANPLYHTMSAAVTPKVASLMIEAFEKRVEKLLEGPGLGGTKAKVPGEGVISKSTP